MDVPEGAESPTDHFVHEAMRWHALGDAGGETLPDAEVTALECYDVARLEKATRAARNRPLSGECRGLAMDLDIAGEVETYVDWPVDLRKDGERWHGVNSAT